MAKEMPLSSGKLTSIVGRLYDAALSPGLWDTVVKDLAAAFHSDFAVFTMFDRARAEVIFNSYFNIDHWMTRKWAELAEHDPMAPVMYRNINEVRHCREVLTAAELHRSRFYQELLKPHQMEYRMGLHCNIDDPIGASLAVFRGPARRPYNRANTKHFSLLTPHVIRASRIQYRLGRTALAGGILRQLIDELPLPIVLVDAQLRLVFANRSAKDLASQSQGIELRHGMLYAEREVHNRQIGQVLRAVLRDERAQGVRLTRGGRRPLQLWTTPLGNDLDLNVPLRELAAIFPIDPELDLHTDPQLVMDVFDLTRAEAELVAGLVDGGNLKAVADARGVTEGTARQQLKSVFSKLDCQSQAELMSQVLRHPLWLAHQAGASARL